MTSGTERQDAMVFRNRTLVVAGVLIAVAIALWLISTLANLLFMIFVSLFVAVAFEPPVHFLEKRGWRRGVATGVVFLVAFLAFVGFVWALAPLFVEQINAVIRAIPRYAVSVVEFLNETFGFDLESINLEEAARELSRYLQTIGGTLVGGVVGLTASVAGFLVFVTTVALFSFYMIAELPKLQRTVLSFIPAPQQRRALHVWDVAVENMGGYIYSRLLLAVVSAVVASTLLTFLEVPFALSLGIWVGVLSQFIPVVGTYLAAVLPALVALTFNGTATMVWVIVFFVAYQQIENYLFSPFITKRTMEIHPAVSVGAIIAGAALMGGIGVILALPMTGIIQAIMSESRRRHDVILDEGDTAPTAV